jgi:hypothetical protein
VTDESEGSSTPRCECPAGYGDRGWKPRNRAVPHIPHCPASGRSGRLREAQLAVIVAAKALYYGGLNAKSFAALEDAVKALAEVEGG